MITSLLIGLAILAGLITMGWKITDLLIGRTSWALRSALAFPLGAGSFTYVLFLLSWAGMPLTPASVCVIYLVVLAGLFGLRALRGPSHEAWEPEGTKGIPLFRSPLPQGILVALLALVFLFESVISVGQAYAAWDAVAMWGIKGYGIALEGSVLAGRSWGAHGLAYPFNIHLLVALFKMLSGDALPGSKLIFPFFLISTVLGSFAFWTRRGVPREWASAGCLLLASVPVFFVHATNGYANLPTACYLVLATFVGAEAVASGSRGGQVLAGLLLGLACWTIVEGMFFAAAILLSLVLARYLGPTGEMHWLHISVPLAAVGGIWLFFYLRYGASGSQAMGAAHAMFASIRAGELNLYAFRMIVGYMRRFVFDPSTWGVLFSAGLLLAIFGFRKLVFARDTVLTATYLVILSTGALSTLLFYLRSFVSEDFYAYLIRGFPRESFQTAIVFAGVVIWASGAQLAGLLKRPSAEA